MRPPANPRRIRWSPSPTPARPRPTPGWPPPPPATPSAASPSPPSRQPARALSLTLRAPRFTFHVSPPHFLLAIRRRLPILRGLKSMADDKKHVYDESKIKTLSSLEHIRLRTGMYIGRIGDGSHYDDGCYILLKEVIDNGIDEYIMGHGKEIQINIRDKSVSVRDFGRGIPLGKVVDCVSQINTGAKYNDDVFQFSVGLNGVGTKAVNALSKEFVVRSHRSGEFVEASFKRGVLKNEKSGKSPNE